MLTVKRCTAFVFLAGLVVFLAVHFFRQTLASLAVAVIRNYSAGMVSEHCHTVAQFMNYLIMTRDYYGRYEGCRL